MCTRYYNHVHSVLGATDFIVTSTFADRMFFRRAFSNPGVFRQVGTLYGDVSGRSVTRSARRCFTLWVDINAKRHISVAKLLKATDSPLAGCRVPDFATSSTHSGLDSTGPARFSSVSNVDGAGDGMMAAAGDEEDTEGTESGRVSRDSAISDGPPEEEAESIEAAHVAMLRNIEGEHATHEIRFREYGNVYEKHEPTMFGDWSHMGRVTDF